MLYINIWYAIYNKLYNIYKIYLIYIDVYFKLRVYRTYLI